MGILNTYAPRTKTKPASGPTPSGAEEDGSAAHVKKASAPLAAEASRSDDRGAPHTVSGFYHKSETEA